MKMHYSDVKYRFVIVGVDRAGHSCIQSNEETSANCRVPFDYRRSK